VNDRPGGASPRRAATGDSALRHGVRIAVRSAQLGAAACAAAATLSVGAIRAGRDREARLGALGRAIASLCTSLGATFIKVGQIASTRADLLPEPMIRELARLRDEVPPFPSDEVRRAIERELGKPVEALFASFEADPVAAASVAQVHRAVLADGTVVAVKVRRPDIGRKVALDRSILLATGRALERIVPSLRLIALEGALRQFCDAVEEQLDLRIEASNNERFTRNFADDPSLVFPAIVPALCTDAVLTMAFIDGVHERDLERSEIDTKAVARAGMRIVCRMIFLHGFVHADLHPGNMRFLPPDRVALFDLGLVGRIDDADRLNTARMLFAFATGDGVTVAKIFHDSSPLARPKSYEAYEREMAVFVSGLQSRGLGNVELGLEIGRLFDILRRHRIQARSHMTMVNLALMTAEGLGKRLAPELNLTEEAIPYLAEALGIQPPRR
jgi:ubiquinone biosynthesis protein